MVRPARPARDPDMARANPDAGLVTPPLETPLLALIADDMTRETVRAAARQLGWNGALVGEGGADATLTLLKTTKPPAVLIVDISDSHDPIADVSGVSALCGSGATIIAVGLVNDVRLYRSLLEAGAHDYLVKPISVEILKETLGAAAQPRSNQPAAAKSARTIALIGSRGGVGTTSLAVSTAWALAERRRTVVLLDLDLHFGSAALSLDIEPGRGLREMLAHPERIDSLLIDAAAGRAGEHLRILSAEEPLEDSFELSPEGLIAVLDTLAQSAEFVVIDIPRVLGPLSRQVLSLSDMIGLVTDLSLPAMRDTQRLVNLIKGIRGAAPMSIIANRVGGVGGEIGLADFERAIGAKVDHTIRFDKAAAVAAAESAKPLIEAAKTPAMTGALQALALRLAGESGDGDKTPATSLFKRVFGG